MGSPSETRSAAKRAAIVEAATGLFLNKGYDGASMDDVAAAANVSKPTVYNHFADKEELFADVVQATADNVDGLVRMVAETLGGAEDMRDGLTELARLFIAAIMRPQTLKLRRLVIANADRFPEVGLRWYSQGFERVLTTLASCFEQYGRQGALCINDPRLAAEHFVGLLLWIPVNRAMFTGNHRSKRADLDRYADAAVNAFLSGYGRGQQGNGRRASRRSVR